MNSSLSKTDIFNVLSGMHCAVSGDGLITQIWGAWEQFLGIQPEELVGSRILERVHQDDLPLTQKTLKLLFLMRASATKSAVRNRRIRNRMRHKDGSFVQFLWSAAVPPGEDTVLLSAYRPSKIETELRLAKTLADALPLHVTMESPDGTRLYDNRNLNTSAHEDESIESGEKAQDSKHFAKILEHQKILHHLYQNGSWAGETVASDPDGASYPVHRTLVALESKGSEPAAVVACIERDLRELNRERMLTRQLEMLVSSTSDLIATASFKGITTYINPAGMALLDRSGETFDSLRLSDILPSQYLQMFVDEVFPAVRRDGIWQGDSELLRKDGSTFPVSQVVLLMRDQHGNPMGYGTIAKDLRTRYALEQSLKKTLQSLSCPILQLDDGILAMPVIGDVDDQRAALMTQTLLKALVDKKCSLFVVDFTGIEAGDPTILERFLAMFSAARWLGATAWVSGISAQMAQNLPFEREVLPELCTFATLSDALSAARSFRAMRRVRHAQPRRR